MHTHTPTHAQWSVSNTRKCAITLCSLLTPWQPQEAKIHFHSWRASSKGEGSLKMEHFALKCLRIAHKFTQQHIYSLAKLLSCDTWPTCHRLLKIIDSVSFVISRVLPVIVYFDFLSLPSFFFLPFLGFYVFSHCTDSQQTVCVKCNRGEYQPNWNEEMRCRKQKLCDEGRSLQHKQEEINKFIHSHFKTSQLNFYQAYGVVLNYRKQTSPMFLLCLSYVVFWGFV